MRELSSLQPYIRRYVRGIGVGLVLVVVANAFAIAAPQLLGMAVDAMREPEVTGGLIAAYAGLVVLAALLSGMARFGMRQVLNGISRRIETDLRADFFRHLLRLDAAFYSRTRTGDLMSLATNDTQAVRMAVGPAVMYLVNTLVITCFALVLMWWISPRLTLMAMIPLLLLPAVVLYFGRIIHRRFERIQEQFATLSTLVQENLSGARIVRAYRQERAQEAEFRVLNADYLDRNMSLARTSGLFHPLLSLFTGAGMVIVLWLGGRQIMAGNISEGEFIAFGIWLGMLTWPMIALGWVINLFQRGAASMGRINQILREQPVIRSPARSVRVGRVRGAIEFQDVHFRYPGTERAVLRGVSFRAPAGTTVALVGPTGAGKSTIVSLLTRLHDPSAGQILLDGVPLPEFDLSELRGAIGMVPQEAFLFSETIEENIALGLPAGAEIASSVREAAVVARLDAAVASFPAGFATRLGERGVNLSGGQRQRATLARALARDPRVLILDDALSAVDTHTETEILDGLRRVLAGRTAFVISHRVTAVMDADVILVLEDGRVVEQGTHADLLGRRGVYASLLRRQLLEEDLESRARAVS